LWMAMLPCLHPELFSMKAQERVQTTNVR